MMCLVKPAAVAFTLVACLATLFGCGRKQDFEYGDELSPAVGGGGKGGVQSTQAPEVITTEREAVTTRTKTLFNIVPVTQIIEATSGIAGWGDVELPFTGPNVAIGQPVTDGQTAFSFNFDYPENNYQFVEAHLVIDTSRDNSDTEGIFVDGIFTGRPPAGTVNMTSPEIDHHIYFGNGSGTENTYYIDWSLAHYKIGTRNSFDLLLSDLLEGSEESDIDTLSDGALKVVTGDDSPVYQAYLVINGRTISSSELSCETSATFTFTNVFLFNDGNTVGQSAFSGSVASPSTGWAQAIGTYVATEFYYDAALPKVNTANVNLTSATLNLRVKRAATGKAAIVINGIGIAETGFDTLTATSEVETWLPAKTSVWETALSVVPTNGTQTDISLNLVDLFGPATLRDLLAQGKLNMSLAGNLIAYGSGVSTNRGFQAPINGPELAVAGTYFTEVCNVPDNPSSPLTQSGLQEVYEETTSGGGSDTVVVNDGESPILTSVQATEITSNAATILWLSDEPATTQVLYGIGGLTTETAEDSNLTTYHQVRLTGLSPYKYYSFQAVSADRYGNETRSDVAIFVTLR